MPRKIFPALAVLLAVAAGALAWHLRPVPVLTVVTWAGPYGRAQAAAQMHPYAAARRVDVRLAEYDGGLARLTGDVIDFELPDAAAACARGLLERIDPASLPPGDVGTPAMRDFVPGAVGPCWVAGIVYSQVILYAPEKFAGAPPQTLADFFDTRKFPGIRALRRASPKFNLEMALLADGAAPGDVYALLSNAAGRARALHRLESLKPGLVWYDSDSEALALLHSGRAAFATARNGQVYDAARAGLRLGAIWDRQLYEMDVFGVPKGSPRKELAMDYVRYATGTARLAGVARWVPYGPARRSAQPLVGANPDTGVMMRPFLPTTHFATAFAVDDGWWRSHGAAMDDVWRSWLAAH